MILDASAVIAVLNREPEATGLVRALADADTRAIGSPTVLESQLVMAGRHGVPGVSAVMRLLDEADVAVVAFTDEHRSVAVEAFLRFGKGRHPAALNFGDCMSYAMAVIEDQPLLCIGDDFARTDAQLVPLG